jgi:hypothetical protein
VWLKSLSPVPLASGLAATSARLELTVRVYKSMTSKPEDAIDTDLLKAASLLVGTYSQNFQLGGTAMEVDLLGAYGDALGSTAGYLDQDGKLYRIVEITLPIIVVDVWAQAA